MPLDLGSGSGCLIDSLCRDPVPVLVRPGTHAGSGASGALLRHVHSRGVSADTIRGMPRGAGAGAAGAGTFSPELKLAMPWHFTRSQSRNRSCSIVLTGVSKQGSSGPETGTSLNNLTYVQETHYTLSMARYDLKMYLNLEMLMHVCMNVFDHNRLNNSQQIEPNYRWSHIYVTIYVTDLCDWRTYTHTFEHTHTLHI